MNNSHILRYCSELNKNIVQDFLKAKIFFSKFALFSLPSSSFSYVRTFLFLLPELFCFLVIYFVSTVLFPALDLLYFLGRTVSSGLELFSFFIYLFFIIIIKLIIFSRAVFSFLHYKLFLSKIAYFCFLCYNFSVSFVNILYFGSCVRTFMFPVF